MEPDALDASQASNELAPKNNSNLNFLRATAVMYVVGFHLLLYRQAFDFRIDLHDLGHWGVLIFFVHTSLVLMLSLYRQPGVRAFFVRRAFRILPLSIAAVVLIWGFELPLDFSKGHFHAARFDLDTLVSNLLLIQNVTHVDSLEAPLWSLPYEMQMYLCLPALFWIVNKTDAAWSAAALWVFGAVGAVLLSWSVRIPHALPFIPWDLFNYAPCFLAGVVAFALAREDLPKLPAWLWPIFIFLLTVLYLLTKHAWTLCLALGIGTALFKPLSAAWVTRGSEVVARYSYGIYLTHFFCIWFAFVRLRASPPLQWAAFVASALTLPVLFFHLIEQPMIQYGARIAARLRRPSLASPRGFEPLLPP